MVLGQHSMNYVEFTYCGVKAETATKQHCKLNVAVLTEKGTTGNGRPPLPLLLLGETSRKEVACMIMDEGSIFSFIAEESNYLHSQGALDHRRRDLLTFYRWLPDDKDITRERLAAWRQYLVEKGYTYNTQVNYVKSVNRYLRFMGKEDWCFSKGKGLDIKGKTFGYLTALEPTEKRYRRDVIWLCQCKCGNRAEVPATRLVSGNTLSCGCLKTDRLHTGNKYIDGTELRCVLDDRVPKPENPSGYLGVSPSRGRWLAQIKYKGQYYYLGRYATPEEAAKAYGRAKEQVQEDARVLEKEWDEIHADDPSLPHRSDIQPMEYRQNYATEQEPTPVPRAVRSNNTSGVPGVSRRRDNWAANITYQKVSYHLGDFSEKEDAISARKNAESLLLADPQRFVEVYGAKCYAYRNK